MLLVLCSCLLSALLISSQWSISMKKLLIIAHAPSANTQALADAAHQAANHHDFDIEVICKSPLQTQADDVLHANAVILGTTENLGYMAGLTKDFFDRCYYQCLDKKQGMAYAIYIRAGFDGEGTKRALQTINNGLKWQLVQPPLVLKGEWDNHFIEQVTELAMTVAAGVDAGIY